MRGYERTAQKKRPAPEGAGLLQYPCVRRLLDLDAADLAVGALLPDVHDVVERLAIALGVIFEVANRGLPRAARLDGLGDLLGVGGARLGDRLRHDLDGGVAVERVGLGLEAGVAELLDQFGGVGTIARVGTEGVQHAFRGRAGNRRELVGDDAVAGDELRLEARVGALADNEAAFGVEAAPIGYF